MPPAGRALRAPIPTDHCTDKSPTAAANLAGRDRSAPLLTIANSFNSKPLVFFSPESCLSTIHAIREERDVLEVVRFGWVREYA